jgi:hypothetical protein
LPDWLAFEFRAAGVADYGERRGGDKLFHAQDAKDALWAQG